MTEVKWSSTRQRMPQGPKTKFDYTPIRSYSFSRSSALFWVFITLSFYQVYFNIMRCTSSEIRSAGTQGSGNQQDGTPSLTCPFCLFLCNHMGFERNVGLKRTMKCSDHSPSLAELAEWSEQLTSWQGGLAGRCCRRIDPCFLYFHLLISTSTFFFTYKFNVQGKRQWLRRTFRPLGVISVYLMYASWRLILTKWQQETKLLKPSTRFENRQRATTGKHYNWLYVVNIALLCWPRLYVSAYNSTVKDRGSHRKTIIVGRKSREAQMFPARRNTRLRKRWRRPQILKYCGDDRLTSLLLVLIWPLNSRLLLVLFEELLSLR